MSSYADKSSDRYLNMEMITPATSEKEQVHPEERSDCLGTLRAVQDLLLKYDELNDEEKTKMTGIKEYLDNQLDYLEKYIASIDELSNQKRDFPIRFKRYIERQNENFNDVKKRGKFKEKVKKILRFNIKKHTKSTKKPSFTQTAKYRRQEAKNHRTKTYVTPVLEQKLDSNTFDPMKRNLKDVYFKAWADSKKISTIKNYQRYGG